MQLPATISCIHPFAREAILALIAIGLAHAVLLRFRTLLGGRTALLVYPAILLLAIWLGWYRVSPLGFSTGRIPLVQGFLIRKSQIGAALIPRRQVVSVRAETPIGIEPVLLPGPTRCIWASTTGGAFDDPNSCDTAYKSAAAAQYDVLKVHVASACGIPAVTREIRISVLPP